MKKLILTFLFFILLGCSYEPVYNDIYIEKEIVINEPTLSVNFPSGEYFNDLTVDFSCPIMNAKVYYTLNDQTPDNKTGLLCAGGVLINKSGTLSYRAYLGETPITRVKKERYSFYIKPVIATPASGEYTADQLGVSLSSESKGVTIVYTTDGSTPAIDNGRVYDGTLAISYFTILKFFAIKEGYKQSEINRYAYSFKVLTPEIFPYSEGGDVELNSDALINIECQTPDVAIYYTLDGSNPSSASNLYNGSIILTPNSLGNPITLKTAAYKYGFAYSETKEEKYLFRVGSVNVFPEGGEYDSEIRATLSSSLSGALIYYTLDGSEPSEETSLYTEPIVLNSDAVVKAIAVKSGFKNSIPIETQYRFKTARPVFSKISGTYSAPQNVEIYCSTTGAEIRYVKTLDGSIEPDGSSPLYTGEAITISDGEILKAAAFKAGLAQSDVSSVTISIDSSAQTVAAPTLSLPSGTYNSVKTLTVTSATDGAKIFYSVDGSLPDLSGDLFFNDSYGDLDIFESQIVRFVAVKDGLSPSNVVSANFIIAGYTLEPPEILLPSGTYCSPEMVEIAHTDPSVILRYTLNGAEPTEESEIFYGTPLVISGLTSSITLKVKSFKNGCVPSDTAVAEYTFKLPPVSFNPAGGEYNNSIGLYLSQPTTGAVIRYTLDGSEPTETYGTIFSGQPIPALNGTTVKAISYKSGWKTSDTTAHTYTLKVNDPIFITSPSKTYFDEVKVQIDIIPFTAKIKYTTDGSDPKTSSNAKEYSGPIALNKSTTIKCVGIRDGWNDSEVVEERYIVE
ncbi:MAG TPA: chitobiase/beta-hexosaminidase C-terminal domain-containing protein [Spirochaetota bacterium]|nr:chitobiase/beta-hexosaminidase C-terminal domain-containing protein [Spirochaetota bacterium]HOS33869.1 chitobiase/beta-hexosaminidase C-terminal domain-containing protein [Spirochaetota bacterium]HOS56848.1 chitobiase/beta-hexosaminidase C-terminal domain-containing protein [Spirochaetota bacterium]HPK62725.1 chitobiase/beta-hexosaminidase C-terminal domain-containing protein [Spirochaetota bacterium]HQF79095.1 chitobiase/beta-hexosaminidase C-terminal domain-containing protein [Spirochaeto